MLKREHLMVGGAVPYRNFKERVREVARIKKDYGKYGKVRIHVENGFIYYEYKEIC